MTEHCVISSATEATKFKIKNIKLYVAVATLSTQDNKKTITTIKIKFYKSN